MNTPPVISTEPMVTTPSTSSTMVSVNQTSALPTPPQAHQHPPSRPTSIPMSPGAHQQVPMSPLRLSSPSPASGLSPPRHNLSPHSPGSPAPTLALIYPGGGPIPLTVGHTSPVGKHGGTLGALTASVTALQRPISTASLHSANSPHQELRANLPPGSRPPTIVSFNPLTALSQGAIRSPKQKHVMTTKTPIFNRSRTVPSTSTPVISSTAVTASPGMVRVSPSTQMVRAQVQAAQAAQAQLQAAKQQVQHILARQHSTGSTQPVAIRPNLVAGPLTRGQSPTIINNAQARLQQALANAAAKYRQIQQRKSQFGSVSAASSPPPTGLVAPSVQQRNRFKSTPNPPNVSQTIKPAPHIPILPRSTSYAPIMPKPVNLTSDKKMKPHDKKPYSPRPQFRQGLSPEMRRSKKFTATLPTATVSATATSAHKTKTPHNATIAGIIKEVTAAFRPEMSARPEDNERPESSSIPEVAVTPEVSVRTELPVTSDVVTIRENGFIEKEVPRAIVRPQVLTHVIDGFIIEESREPFPVRHVDELPDVIPEQSPKPKPQKQQKSKQPRKDTGDNSVDDGNMLTCEFCGKTAPARSFTRSKRFCSKSCAKRYNVGCSKRLGLFSPKRDNPPKVKQQSMKIKTKTAKPLKGVRGKHGRLDFNVGQPWNVNRPQAANPQKPFHHQHHHQQQQQQHRPQHPQLQHTDSSTSSSSSQSASEESASPSQVSEPDTAPGSDDDAFEDAPSGGIPRDPAVWSVLDVFEFIRTLPGCESYADEFRRQEIDGQALLLLKEDHLMTAMNMKLGPALKIINKINSLKNK